MACRPHCNQLSLTSMVRFRGKGQGDRETHLQRPYSSRACLLRVVLSFFPRQHSGRGSRSCGSAPAAAALPLSSCGLVLILPSSIVAMGLATCLVAGLLRRAPAASPAAGHPQLCALCPAMQLSPAVHVRLLLSQLLRVRGSWLQLQVRLRPQLREGVPIARQGWGHGQIVQDSLLGQRLAVMGGQAQQGISLVHQLSVEHRLQIQVLLQGLQGSKDSQHSVG